ncbi:MAG: trigger factor [Pseudomonadota bacterium]
MQVLNHKESGLQHTLEIKVTEKEIDAIIESELVEVGKTVKIAGFRPGKVPMPILRQKYGRMILSDVINKAVNQFSQKAMDDKKLKPAGQPEIKVDKFEEGQPLNYTLTIDVMPQFDLIDLKKISVEKLVAKVEKKTIDERLTRILEGNAELELVTEDRATKKGDTISVDFHGQTKEGETVPGMSGHDMQIKLGTGQMIPGFEDQLVGKKAGAHCHVDVTFPKDYGAKELAGKEAMFHVDIKAVYEERATTLDSVAKKFNMADEAALKDAVEKDIAGEYSGVTRMKLKRALLDVFDDAYDFPLPPNMVKSEHQFVVSQVEQERKAEGKPVTDEEKAALLSLAERRVRLGLVLAEVGKSQKIEVTQDELHKAVVNEAMRYQGQERQVFEYYQKNPQVIESLRAPIYEDKVIDYILSEAKVSEKAVSVEELTAEEDEDLLALAKGKKAEKKPAAKKK